MSDDLKLTKDQRERIEATLKRIRAGLDKTAIEPMQEPAHLFVPETRHAD